MKTVCIIPAYNEDKTIGNMIKSAKKHVDEIIVIDDGSTDKTKDVAKKAGAAVYSHNFNMGLGKTMRDGYMETIKTDADVIVQIDADGQYLPEEIPKLLEPIRKNMADMVLGSRFKGKIEEMPRIKRMGNLFFSKLTSFLAGQKITDSQTGFRAMRREIAELIIPTGKYTYTQEMVIRSIKEGYRVYEVPVYFAKRVSGESRLISNVFSYGGNSLSIMIGTFREYHPMKFFGIPGLIFILLGLIIGADVVYSYLTTGVMNRPGTGILSSLMIIFGTFLIFIGLIADMLESKYRQIRELLRRNKK